MSQVLAQRLIEPYTPDCRADLGDARCGVEITDPVWTRPGLVTPHSMRSRLSQRSMWRMTRLMTDRMTGSPAA